MFDLERFVAAQQFHYEQAKRELQEGQKRSCWIWFIFPQIAMGSMRMSPTSMQYAIRSLAEADAYLKHPILGARLREVTEIVLNHRETPIDTLMGWKVDAMKFRSCMTLFALVSPPGSVFRYAVDVFFEGEPCPITIEKLQNRAFDEVISDGEEPVVRQAPPRLRRLQAHDSDEELSPIEPDE
jgi:uncharacterized protein (DUF1810 family)